MWERMCHGITKKGMILTGIGEQFQLVDGLRNIYDDKRNWKYDGFSACVLVLPASHAKVRGKYWNVF